MTWTINETDVSDQFKGFLADLLLFSFLGFSLFSSFFNNFIINFIVTENKIDFIGSERFVTAWSWALWTFVDLSVGVTKLDGDISDFFTHELNGLKKC